jgi:hypothetical protein
MSDAGTRRFDVTRTRRTREFWHVALSGDVRMEDA